MLISFGVLIIRALISWKTFRVIFLIFKKGLILVFWVFFFGSIPAFWRMIPSLLPFGNLICQSSIALIIFYVHFLSAIRSFVQVELERLQRDSFIRLMNIVVLRERSSVNSFRGAENLFVFETFSIFFFEGGGGG